MVFNMSEKSIIVIAVLHKLSKFKCSLPSCRAQGEDYKNVQIV